MKSYALLFACALNLAGCSGNGSNRNEGNGQTPKTSVTTTHAAYGSISQSVALSATTAYLDKSTITAPIPAFVMKAMVQTGTYVKKGQPIYILESKERHALGRNGEDGDNGIIQIKAAHSGIVLDVQQQTGCYVTEGSTLCTIADAGSLVFIINMPYEQKRYARNGSICMLELPDGTQLKAVVQSTLATMDASSQSEQVIARAKAPLLPEGMTVKALFTTNDASGSKNILLPKSAVQSDETMNEYWVMKLSDDSTATKVPVKVVCSNTNEVEIKDGTLSPKDQIILTGGYGLEDGAKVTVNNR